ncbi:NAD-dependent epimerase/dehydratase family protein [Kaistia dalseonensis]|uniref:UDP-glucuronate 4-epimerase n=1 Tax=Kaistia dalseonensis TaxID=410840 RepID=A0ABU0H5S4_9HYPH|nr:NAD-dependent epimerase/dehydratase family protein [Kaistia dalseonensis]MCX5495080.1 NAD-dependent epimerase/dehydratase family protein [Kaistia dalseonensis]MDQ0437662.1 UDP-glucuronate 4-epimerase [Kaistia dalseonensis]
MKTLVTGAAGFIGSEVALALLARGDTVIGLDNLNSYYDPALKRARLDRLAAHRHFEFVEASVSDMAAIERLISVHADIEVVVHLAAQAGVAYSIENPLAYVDANVTGQTVIFEAVRHLAKLRHIVYASSSSVYGLNEDIPFRETDRVDRPASLYAATKRAGELIAHSYAHVHGVASTGLRFFTVYGPWGRPDMAPWLFTGAILEGRPITVFNNGEMRRDFTYIDDIVAGTLGAIDRQPQPAEAKIFNLGNNKPVALMDFIASIEAAAGRKAEIVFAPMRKADVIETFADIEAADAAFGYNPQVRIDEGIARFVAWFRGYNARP